MKVIHKTKINEAERVIGEFDFTDYDSALDWAENAAIMTTRPGDWWEIRYDNGMPVDIRYAISSEN